MEGKCLEFVCADAYMEARGLHQMPSSVGLHVVFVTRISPSLKLINMAWLAGWLANSSEPPASTSPVLVLQIHAAVPTAGNSNSGHVCTALLQ